MDKVSKLKEIIVDLRMDLLKTKIYKGSCPYSLYIPTQERKVDCSIGCERCREIFLRDMEKDIRKEVEEL